MKIKDFWGFNPYVSIRELDARLDIIEDYKSSTYTAKWMDISQSAIGGLINTY